MVTRIVDKAKEWQEMYEICEHVLVDGEVITCCLAPDEFPEYSTSEVESCRNCDRAECPFLDEDGNE